jgi:hypothetical protein
LHINNCFIPSLVQDNTADKDPSFDANSLKEVKKAWAYFLLLMHITHPAILVYHTLDIFLEKRSWFYNEDYGSLNQWTYATRAIDYMLSVIATRYRAKQKPPTETDFGKLLSEFDDGLFKRSKGIQNRASFSGKGGKPQAQRRSGDSSPMFEDAKREGICFQWNQETGCQRFKGKNSAFCMLQSKKLLHVCCEKNQDGSTCKSSSHRAYQHLKEKKPFKTQ